MADPAPFTPPECDLRDFAFMPLEIERLRRSRGWLMAKRDPSLGFYLLNLWMASWHELPAASLEDDDEVLADLAMCDTRRWKSVRDKVLRGWVKCSDGRLYHPVVAEKAKEAWERKLAQRQRTEAARQARRSNRQNSVGVTTDTGTALVAGSVTENATTSVTENATGQSQHPRDRDRDSRKRESPPTPPGGAAVTEDLVDPPDPHNCVEAGTGREIVGGYYLDNVWSRVCDAAGVGPDFDDKAVRSWLREGIIPDTFVPVIQKCAGRSGYSPPRSLTYFDRPVREAHRKTMN